MANEDTFFQNELKKSMTILNGIKSQASRKEPNFNDNIKKEDLDIEHVPLQATPKQHEYSQVLSSPGNMLRESHMLM